MACDGDVWVWIKDDRNRHRCPHRPIPRGGAWWSCAARAREPTGAVVVWRPPSSVEAWDGVTQVVRLCASAASDAAGRWPTGSEGAATSTSVEERVRENRSRVLGERDRYPTDHCRPGMLDRRKKTKEEEGLRRGDWA